MNKFLVYTSMGDHGNVSKWLPNDKFDLWITYYGNSVPSVKPNKLFYRKGSKFQNFYDIYINNPDIQSYDAIALFDDDLIINPNQIYELFTILTQYNLWIVSPSHSPQGKLSFDVMRTQEDSFLRYVNFIEVTAPIFSKYAITQFMSSYSSEFMEWGVEHLYMKILGIEHLKYAVVDAVSCINPLDVTKPFREISNLGSNILRFKNFLKLVEQYDLVDYYTKMGTMIMSLPLNRGSTLKKLKQNDILLKPSKISHHK